MTAPQDITEMVSREPFNTPEDIVGHDIYSLRELGREVGRHAVQHPEFVTQKANLRDLWDTWNEIGFVLSVLDANGPHDDYEPEDEELSEVYGEAAE